MVLLQTCASGAFMAGIPPKYGTDKRGYRTGYALSLRQWVSFFLF
jgi:hypothetical protein